MRRTLIATLMSMLLLTACSTTEVETFRQPAVSRVDDAWLSSDAEFTRYRSLYIVPLEIYFYEGMGQPSPEVVARIRDIFRSAFLNVIGDDYVIVDQPSPDALGVRGSLVDLKHSQALGSLPVTGRAARLVANGQLTFFMELTDSQTGEVLARAADQEKEPSQPRPMTDESVWLETESAAQRWATLFRAFLDENLGH